MEGVYNHVLYGICFGALVSSPGQAFGDSHRPDLRLHGDQLRFLVRPFICLCIVVGFFIGKALDGGSSFKEIFDRLFSKKEQ